MKAFVSISLHITLLCENHTLADPSQNNANILIQKFTQVLHLLNDIQNVWLTKCILWLSNTMILIIIALTINYTSLMNYIMIINYCYVNHNTHMLI